MEISITTTEMVFGPSHLSRLVLDPGLKGSLVPVPTARGRNRSLIPVGATKRVFGPGWWLQPGPKGSSCVSIKEKHPIQVHMRCVGGVVKKLRASRGISGSSPRLRRIVFTLPHDPFGPGYLTRDQRSGSFSPGSLSRFKNRD